MTNKNLHIGIDLDGVVIDHTAKFLRIAKELGHPLQTWQANSNTLKHAVPKQAADIIKQRVYTEERGDEPPYPDALAVIARIAPLATIVSVQKDPRSEPKTLAWLESHGVTKLIPADRIIFVRTREEKVRRITALAPAYFVDDGLDVLEDLSPATIPVLFDPVDIHTRVPVAERIVVVPDWKTLAKLLDTIRHLARLASAR